ncbi:hypothetical protein F5Y17DRAFT_210131 [Xylariaceae sp. FL0594]|nr:hypothetical protein F5Y17DRAFT_210131 [Xylariaceae sp. FL0594]
MFQQPPIHLEPGEQDVAGQRRYGSLAIKEDESATRFSVFCPGIRALFVHTSTFSFLVIYSESTLFADRPPIWSEYTAQVMSRTLPAQESKVGTYMEDSVIVWHIDNRLGKDHQESDVKDVWNLIICFHFIRLGGYSLSTEKGVPGGRMDMLVSELVHNPGRSSMKPFWIIECKAPGLEGQSAIWRDALDQLRRYYHGLTRGQTRKYPRYAAIAVGKTVRFYEFDPTTQEAQDFRGDGSVYRIDRQCQTITRHLEYIRNHI